MRPSNAIQSQSYALACTTAVSHVALLTRLRSAIAPYSLCADESSLLLTPLSSAGANSRSCASPDPLPLLSRTLFEPSLVHAQQTATPRGEGLSTSKGPTEKEERKGATTMNPFGSGDDRVRQKQRLLRADVLSEPKVGPWLCLAEHPPAVLRNVLVRFAHKKERDALMQQK